jgi:UDP-N-acetylglucosamine--N-acetylmuramyl-(pentapeptide) pyrophosphoryl-undecaprenol N-acetylglucosamine transferase
VTIVIAAAGTGGHVFPALAVAGELVAGGVPPERIHFFGGDRLEADAVPATGFGFTSFHLVRLERSPTARNLRIPVAVRHTARAMADQLIGLGATVVLGMGGYIVVPVALAARRAGIPFYLHEQNAAPGLASRFAAGRASRVFVGLPGRSQRLHRAELVGNPLRRAVERFDRAGLRPRAAARYGLGSARPVVGILGGSLGARALNEAAAAVAAGLEHGAVLQLTGRTPEAQVPHPSTTSEVTWVRRAFEPEIELFYAAADLVVCRAGAMTVSELAATGTPSVLVPLQRVRQEANARALAAAGGAVALGRGDMRRLTDIVTGIVSDAGRLRAMAEAARGAALLGAARLVAGALVEAAGGLDA